MLTAGNISSIFYLDTSALVRRYHSEVGTEFVGKVFGSSDIGIRISRLGVVEFSSVCALRARSNVFTRRAASDERWFGW
jgi:hypothetical protein